MNGYTSATIAEIVQGKVDRFAYVEVEGRVGRNLIHYISDGRDRVGLKSRLFVFGPALKREMKGQVVVYGQLYHTDLNGYFIVPDRIVALEGKLSLITSGEIQHALLLADKVGTLSLNEKEKDEKKEDES